MTKAIPALKSITRLHRNCVIMEYIRDTKADQFLGKKGSLCLLPFVQGLTDGFAEFSKILSPNIIPLSDLSPTLLHLPLYFL